MFNEKTKDNNKKLQNNLNYKIKEDDKNENNTKDNTEKLVGKENNENKKSQNEDDKKLHKLSGFFLFYLVCITSSIMIKIILDKTFIREYNYFSRDRVNNFFIACYLSLTYISLALYMMYSCIVKKEKDREKGKNTVSSMKLFGYIVYSENKPSKDICCCYSCYNCCECFEDCLVCCQTLNMSLCCYMCSCICCLKCIFCCKCDKFEDINKNRMRKNEDINKIERIFVFYRVSGRWNWLAKIMTDTKIYPLALTLYFIHLTNMGFEDIIWSNQEKNKNEDEYIINMIILGAILLFYIINRYGGKCIVECIEKYINKGSGDLRKSLEECPEEFQDIFIGFIPYILAQTIISFIFSALIYFNALEINNYFLSITIASVEYIKINILEIISFFIETNYKSLEFFSSSTIFSIYLLIWDITLFFLSLADYDNKNVILFQFIIGVSVVGIFALLSICVIIGLSCEESNSYNNNNNNLKGKDLKDEVLNALELGNVENKDINPKYI